ncbi:hypothetical protein ACLOJK_004572 [Asimina triloba]
MDEEERLKIIAVRKCPEEVGVEQVSREVLRPDASVPFEWKLLEEVLGKARGMARERLEVERERCRVEGAILELCSAENAREEASRLSSELDVKRDECDEAVGRVVVAKEEVLRFLTALVALRSETKALRAHSNDPDTGKESSRARLEAARREVSALQEQVVVLSSRKSELPTESETIRAEVA